MTNEKASTPLVHGHSALIVKIVLGLALAAVSASIGYHQGEISQLWVEVSKKVDLDNAPPPLYRAYVDSRLESIQEDVEEIKADVKDLVKEMRRHIEEDRRR